MPDTDRARLIEDIFHDALDIDASERAAFLADRCGNDSDLARDVAELLEADAAATAIVAPSSSQLAAALAAEDTALGTTLGPWTLEAVVGAGGMGRVYRATRRADFEQRAAVKVIRHELGGTQILERFRRERATLARLEHPGIARLLDGGATEDGRPWLATEYVDGQQLDVWCATRSLDRETRLKLFLDICDAVSYAHRRLVVHRDLKPANILVDERGTPRLLDFGIAKVLESVDAETDLHGTPHVDESSEITLAGASPMTPAYASPEQLSGRGVSAASDVYALGVILHELLTGERPARDGNPAHALPRDLDAVIAKALAERPEDRYGDVARLAEDVRRHLTHFPVAALRDTWSYRARCFVRRQRAAAALGAALLALGVAAAVQTYDAYQRDQAQFLDILRLSDGARLRALRADMDGPLWPPRDNAAALDAWLTEAREVLGRREQHARRLATLTATIESGEGDDDTTWWHGELKKLTDVLDDFASGDIFGQTVASVEVRRRRHDEIVTASFDGPAAEAWKRAIASIRAPDECPAYEGLELTPQWGLVPLGRQPDTGLWEFFDVQTGAPPTRADDDILHMDDDSAVVFVLLPGGRFAMGSQRSDRDYLNYDPSMAADEAPLHAVELQPFFLSKYELTQGQWKRMRGDEPSHIRAKHENFDVSLEHPVEQVSWNDAHEQMRRHGWVLPTEAQWEYAARGGTHTRWSVGDDISQLDTVANLADLDARELDGPTGWSYAGAVEHDLRDGHLVHAPVGSFRANPFGLHDMHGNVWEWCRDMPMPYLPTIVIAPDGEREIPADIGDLDTRILRGGSFGSPPERLRSAARWSADRDFRTQAAGVRPARNVDP